jgi:succinate dehydrogenase / fumarate reductase cytochrome b subunit
VFHFSNGLWAFFVSWGITVGPKAQRVSTVITMGIFVIFTVLFIMSLVAFRGAEFALLQQAASHAIG